MQLLYSGYLLLLLFVSLVNLLWAVSIWVRHRDARARFFACLLLSIFLMASSSMISATSATADMADFWMSKVRFIGVATAPVFFLLFVLSHCHFKSCLSPIKIGILLMIPLMTAVIAWTNEHHHFFISQIDYRAYDDFLFRETWKPGPWFWVHTAYCYAILVFVVFLLLRNIRGTQYPWRGQAILMFIGALFPVLTNVLAVTQVVPGPALDLTSFGLTATALAFFWAMHHYRLLHLLPMASEQILENMESGVIILDNLERMVHVNPAMLALMKDNLPQEATGMQINELLPHWLHADDLFQEGKTCRKPADEKTPARYYQINSAPLFWKGRNVTIGKIVLLHDVTALTEAMQEKERLITALKEKQSELEILAMTDPLTGLYNRRYFFQNAQQEFKRAHRYQRPVSVIMADIDHFKRINDNYGHDVGDAVLTIIAAVLKKSVRNVDFLSRFGGEEFIIMLPETEKGAACLIAERILHEVRDTPFTHADKPFTVTLSLGLASLHETVSDLEKLTKMADDALYQAKKNGRNQICVQ